MEANLDQDIILEKEFLTKVKELGVATELEIMIKVYNEQLEQLARIRVDADIFDYLLIAEPGVKEHLENKTKNSRALLGKRKLIATIRKQIEKLVERGANARH